ncbi:unnamed protein product, partial [Owenia fusiformis]
PVLVLLILTVLYHIYIINTIFLKQTTRGSEIQPDVLAQMKDYDTKSESQHQVHEPPHVGEKKQLKYEIHIDKKWNHNKQELFDTIIKSDPPLDGKYEQPNEVHNYNIVEKIGKSKPEVSVDQINTETLGDKNTVSKLKNVYFAKTHKAASTTIQNLLFRYGEKYNLTFAMPWNIHRAGYPNHFTPDVIMPLAKGYNEYNVFCHHTRFHPRVLDFMPHDTLYIGAVRSVEKQFLSGYMYHKFYECYGMKNENITQVLEIMQGYKHGLQCSKWKVSSQSEQMFDFGLQIEDMSNITMIKDYIHYLDSVFDFIFVADYFYESLVLLADILNLPLSDMVFYQLMQVKRHPELSTKDILILKKWNIADYMLYDHFNQSFWRRVELYGENKLNQKVEALKQLQDSALLNCLKNPENILCELMELQEPQFTHDLKMKMVFEEHLNIKVGTQIKFHTKWPSKLGKSYPFHSKTFKQLHFRNSRIEKHYLSVLEQK